MEKGDLDQVREVKCLAYVYSKKKRYYIRIFYDLDKECVIDERTRQAFAYDMSEADFLRMLNFCQHCRVTGLDLTVFEREIRPFFSQLITLAQVDLKEPEGEIDPLEMLIQIIQQSYPGVSIQGPMSSSYYVVQPQEISETGKLPVFLSVTYETPSDVLFTGVTDHWYSCFGALTTTKRKKALPEDVDLKILKDNEVQLIPALVAEPIVDINNVSQNQVELVYTLHPDYHRQVWGVRKDDSGQHHRIVATFIQMSDEGTPETSGAELNEWLAQPETMPSGLVMVRDEDCARRPPARITNLDLALLRELGVK